MTSTLDRFKGRAVAEGFTEKTPAFDLRVLEIQVESCRDLQQVGACSACPAYDHCEVLKEYLRAQVRVGKKEPGHER